MSTIQKCCVTVKQFQNVLNEIKIERQKLQQKQQKTSRGLSQGDRKKILKLFNYDKWSNYMKWVDEKLEQSGEDLDSFMEASSRVVTPSSSEVELHQDTGDQITTKKQAKYEDEQSVSIENQSEYDLLLKQNKKLTKHNGQLKKQYDDIVRKHAKILK